MAGKRGVYSSTASSRKRTVEDGLLQAARDRTLQPPYVYVNFRNANLTRLTEVTSLDAPHRVYDAILRDSLLGTQPFMKSELGLRLVAATPEDATALFETSPTALLFGAWHSTGEGGGFGAKFARCLTSEIVALDVPVDEVTDARTGEMTPRTAARRTGSRIDPLGVLRKVEVFKGAQGWDTTKDKAGKGAVKVRPSEINHGNVAPSVQELGITCDYAEHTFVLSFAALRRLSFGSDERSAAARTLLAALGLVAFAEQDARGYSLRSRCELVCEGKAPLELVHPDGSTTAVAIDRAGAAALYADARRAAVADGFGLAMSP